MKSILFALIALLPLSAMSQSETLRKLSMQENQMGIFPHFRGEDVRLDSIEIPISALTGVSDFKESEIPPFLIHDLKGETYFRWLFNPDDVKYKNELIERLKLKKVYFRIGPKIPGLISASRSVFLWDEKSNRFFSFKTSTNRVGKNIQDKAWTTSDAIDAVEISRYASKISFDNIVIFPDRLSLGFEEFGWTLRDLSPIQNSERIYIPMAALFNKDFQRTLLNKTKDKNIYTYFRDRIVRPLAVSMAEFTAKTGLCLDSPHSQNFFIELDNHLIPTGKFGIRDLSDVFIVDKLMQLLKENKQPSLDLKKIHRPQLVSDKIINWFDLFHMVPLQDWISYTHEGEGSMSRMVDSYYSTFRREFFWRTSIPIHSPSAPVKWQQRHFEEVYTIDASDVLHNWLPMNLQYTASPKTCHSAL